LPSTWRAAAVGLDSMTAACAALNLSYFLYRLGRRREETAPRVVAVFALALVSLGALGESLFFLASLTVLPAGSPPAALPWALVRVLPLSGAAFVSALILRQLLAEAWTEDTPR
jgi:hypothetical protein